VEGIVRLVGRWFFATCRTGAVDGRCDCRPVASGSTPPPGMCLHGGNTIQAPFGSAVRTYPIPHGLRPGCGSAPEPTRLPVGLRPDSIRRAVRVGEPAGSWPPATNLDAAKASTGGHAGWTRGQGSIVANPFVTIILPPAEGHGGRSDCQNGTSETEIDVGLTNSPGNGLPRPVCVHARQAGEARLAAKVVSFSGPG
jgi:hypothetical protein